MAGSFSVTVTSPAPGGGTSGSASFAVNNPLPATASSAPAHAMAGAAQPLLVNGSNFVPGATVSFNGHAEQTTFVSTTQLSLTVPAADNAVGGSVPIVVTNPAPGGGTSAPGTFTADSFTVGAPVTPVTVSAGQTASFVITVGPADGNGF